MPKTTYVYVTYIRTTPQKCWNALTDPEFQHHYWAGVRFSTKLKNGVDWKMIYPDGTITDTGEVLEAKPPKRLVLRWRNEFRPELKAEGFSRCVMQIDPYTSGVVKLTVTHSINYGPKSKFINAVSGGWPFVLSNLKTFLETGTAAIKEKKR